MSGSAGWSMSELGAQTIFDFAAALAHNLAVDTLRRADLPFVSDEWLPAYEQQYLGLLAPGVAVFVSRLSAALPDELDLSAILGRFFADPATTTALTRYGEDAAAGQAGIAAALEQAGLPPGSIGDGDLREALAAWSAAGNEVARQNAAANYAQTAANTPLYSIQQPPAAEALQADMAALVQALAQHGLSRIDGGDILAEDGPLVLFSWRRGQRGEREPLGETSSDKEVATSGAEPPSGIQENLSSGGSLDVVSGGGVGMPSPAPSVPSIPDVPSTDPTAPTVPTTGGPAPAPVDADVLTLRLDTGAPPQVTVGIPFDLVAAIRLTDSPVLVVDDLLLRESTAFTALLPQGGRVLSLRIQIAAPECDISGGDSRTVRLLRGQDGPTVYFQLTPRRAGPLSIIVTVYQETDWVGSTRLRTEVAGSAATGGQVVASPAAGVARGAVGLTVQSRPLTAGEVNRQTLRQLLDQGYSLSELRDLCFELNVDYDDLGGEGKAAKARELVTYCERRQMVAALVALIMRDRPHLLVP